MSPERRDPANPAEWLRHARSNLAVAQGGHGLPDVLFESLCFEAHQAAEKAIKAILVSVQRPFPKTHSLVQLFDMVESAGIDVPGDIRESDVLTEYSVEARYPSLEEVTQEEYEWVLVAAEKVVRWAEGLILRKDTLE